MRNGIHQMNDSFLASDATDKQNIRSIRIDAETLQNSGVRLRLILLRVDAIVDNPHLRFIDIKEPQNVLLGFLRYSDHRIRHLDSGFLEPAGKIVAARQLHTLPRSQRLQ